MQTDTHKLFFQMTLPTVEGIFKTNQFLFLINQVKNVTNFFDKISG